jgi:hypothetical protein
MTARKIDFVDTDMEALLQVPLRNIVVKLCLWMEKEHLFVIGIFAINQMKLIDFMVM